MIHRRSILLYNMKYCTIILTVWGPLYMHYNINATDAKSLLLVHLECATQWKQLWFKLLTSTDTKRDYRLENIYTLGRYFMLLLCIYCSACKVCFESWFLHFTLYTEYENRWSFVKFPFFRNALQAAFEGGASLR